jgi:hypothetical protein
MRWMTCDLIPDKGKSLFSSPKLPDQLQGQPSLLDNGYRGLLSFGVKLQSGAILLSLHTPSLHLTHFAQHAGAVLITHYKFWHLYFTKNKNTYTKYE